MVSIPNERTAREVAKVPPARRAEVVSRAAEAGPVSSASIARAAKQTPPPRWATADYTDPRMLLLASLCRELQRLSGDGVFFLSVRVAGRLVGALAVCGGRLARIEVAC